MTAAEGTQSQSDCGRRANDSRETRAASWAGSFALPSPGRQHTETGPMFKRRFARLAAAALPAGTSWSGSRRESKGWNMKHYGVVAKVLAAFSGAVVSVSLASPAHAVSYYEYQNMNSLKCLAVPNSSTANGTELIQWSCGSGTEQKWGRVDVGNTTFRLVNENSGKCLAIGNSSTANGANAIQWTCGSNSDQLWEWSTNYAKALVNVNSGKCLAVGNSSTANGAAVIQWTCSSNSDQVWQ